MQIRLSAVVICQNEAPRIEACLDALAFCDEIVVVDSGSTDGTQSIVTKKGARLLERPFVGMNDQKDFARQAAQGEWVLNVDADEVVPSALATCIKEAVHHAPEHIGAYRFPFKNHFRSVWVRRAGYFPDYHVRLVRKERAYWDLEVPMHDRVVVNGVIGTLPEAIEHYSFDSLDGFLTKSRRYAQAFAHHAFRQGRRAGLTTIFTHTVARFLKTYLLKGGFLDGTLGFVICGLQTYEVFQKYARLWELSRFGIASHRED